MRRIDFTRIPSMRNRQFKYLKPHLKRSHLTVYSCSEIVYLIITNGSVVVINST